MIFRLIITTNYALNLINLLLILQMVMVLKLLFINLIIATVVINVSDFIYLNFQSENLVNLINWWFQIVNLIIIISFNLLIVYILILFIITNFVTTTT